MIRGVYRDGIIQPLDPLPADWIEGREVSIDSLPSGKSEKPDRLYKYERPSDQALQNLKDQRIYFGSPLNFNDPYDCALTPSFKIPTDDEVEALRRDFLQDTELSGPFRQHLTTGDIQQLRKLIESEASKALKSQIKIYMNKIGVSCFSKRSDNLLMWSHYGDHHRGFCLEFCTAALPFKTTVKKVSYVQTMPSIDVAGILLGRDSEVVQQLFCTKSSDWKYEEEWRVIHQNHGTKLGYSAEALTGIYFGVNIDQEMLEKVSLIIRNQNPDIRLWKGKRLTAKFRVLFEEST